MSIVIKHIDVILRARMKILYFSWIKDKVGINEEVLEIDEEINTVQN